MPPDQKRKKTEPSKSEDHKYKKIKLENFPEAGGEQWSPEGYFPCAGDRASARTPLRKPLKIRESHKQEAKKRECSLLKGEDLSTCHTSTLLNISPMFARIDQAPSVPASAQENEAFTTLGEWASISTQATHEHVSINPDQRPVSSNPSSVQMSPMDILILVIEIKEWLDAQDEPSAWYDVEAPSEYQFSRSVSSWATVPSGGSPRGN
ncbi:hypothetical protein F5B22DRAFT_652356 [Xylaria bambusicola]|uniref:uncharacterized protein n=1 Tax=Xylaria bambusicola TaxID=326684 RepID=UPI00200750ED|nr:uncharacterized protein F5B22DRAFT_652356 [Xylaria bambusicola]KAI0503152.1 hypothetical protein F5B22DRAFT_652356 [Xylaria bambusicola]